jgi:hypothetical protein
MIMGLPMMFLTFCNFSIKTGLILSAPQEQGHTISSFEKFFDKSPIGVTVKVVIPSRQYEKLLKIPKSKIPKRKQTELEEITKYWKSRTRKT